MHVTDEPDRPTSDDAEASDGSARARYEWSSIDPSTAVIETVASALGRDPTTIEPLYDSLDPDALNALLRSNASSADGGLTLSFPFADRWVTVHSGGEIVVRPLPGD